MFTTETDYVHAVLYECNIDLVMQCIVTVVISMSSSHVYSQNIILSCVCFRHERIILQFSPIILLRIAKKIFPDYSQYYQYYATSMKYYHGGALE